MSAPLLEISHLTKHFRSYWTFQKLPAVNDISLSVNEGEAFGFLGHNGAGKTTTMKCVVGLLKQNSGEIFYKGQSLEDHKLRAEIGYLPELPYFYDHLSVSETCHLFARLYGIPEKERNTRVEEVLTRIKLIERKNQRVRELSKGLQQRLGMASAILNRPKLLLLDEPFSGLDPIGRKEFRDLLFELKASGSTIFLSTHVLSDIEDICERVSIMAQGRMKKTLSMKELPGLFGTNFELSLLVPEKDQIVLETLNQFSNAVSLREGPQGKTAVLAFHEQQSAQQALSWAGEKNLVVESFCRVIPRLEDVFLEVTKQAEKDR